MVNNKQSYKKFRNAGSCVNGFVFFVVIIIEDVLLALSAVIVPSSLLIIFDIPLSCKDVY